MSSHPGPTMASSALRSIPFLSWVKVFWVSPGKVLSFPCREHTNNNDSLIWWCAIFRFQSLLTSIISLDFSRGSVRKAGQIFSPHFTETEHSEVGTLFLPMLQRRKQRHKEIKTHRQDHNIQKRERWDGNPRKPGWSLRVYPRHTPPASSPHLEKIWAHSRSLGKSHWLRGKKMENNVLCD